MSYSRPFGGHPPHQNHPNPPRGAGPAYNREGGFFRNHDYDSHAPGPQNNVETGNPRRYNQNRNFNGGRWENGHPGQRGGSRPNMGQENYRPGSKNYRNGPAANQGYQRMPRPNQNQAQGRSHSGYQPYHRPGDANNQRQPYHHQGYNANQDPRRMYVDNDQPPRDKLHGGRNRRNRRNNRINQNHLIPMDTSSAPSSSPSLSSPSFGSIDDGLLMPLTPEDQPPFLVPSCVLPQPGVDRDGDVEMTEAPPMDSEIIRLLTEGAIALHEVTRIMLETVRYHR